jgi:hypothetical protein
MHLGQAGPGSVSGRNSTGEGCAACARSGGLWLQVVALGTFFPATIDSRAVPEPGQLRTLKDQAWDIQGPVGVRHGHRLQPLWGQVRHCLAASHLHLPPNWLVLGTSVLPILSRPFTGEPRVLWVTTN